MAEQFYLRFKTGSDTCKAESLLQSLRVSIDGEQEDKPIPAFYLQRRENSLLAQCNVTHNVPNGAILLQKNSRIRFFYVFYLMEALKSGCHHPDGILWIHQPNTSPQCHEDKVSLRAVAPTILRLLG